MKGLFLEKIQVMPLVGRLKHFTNNWKILTQHQNILSVEEGFRLPFLNQPVQQKIPREINVSKSQKI